MMKLVVAPTISIEPSEAMRPNNDEALVRRPHSNEFNEDV
jgi:hypothetical protein